MEKSVTDLQRQWIGSKLCFDWGVWVSVRLLHKPNICHNINATNYWCVIQANRLAFREGNSVHYTATYGFVVSFSRFRLSYKMGILWRSVAFSTSSSVCLCGVFSHNTFHPGHFNQSILINGVRQIFDWCVCKTSDEENSMSNQQKYNKNIGKRKIWIFDSLRPSTVIGSGFSLSSGIECYNRCNFYR